jgi:hypothetical protein
MWLARPSHQEWRGRKCSQVPEPLLQRRAVMRFATLIVDRTEHLIQYAAEAGFPPCKCRERPPLSVSVEAMSGHLRTGRIWRQR